MRYISNKTTKILFGAYFVLYSELYAQSRGGGCGDSLICKITGGIAFLAIVIFFFVTVWENMRKNGIVDGIIHHKGIRIIAGYLGMMAAILGIAIVLMNLFGEK